MGKFTCPYCCAEHDITDSDLGLKCSCNAMWNPCKFGIPKDKDGWIALAYKKKCVNCKEAAIQLYCHHADSREIPVELLSVKSLPVVLLGISYAGKSVYLGVLVNEIRQKMAGLFNCSFSMIRNAKDEYDELFYNRLYKHGHMVNKTMCGLEVPPLLFRLIFMNMKNKIINKAALSFYDTMGEILTDEDMLYRSNRYITNAQGIFLFLDPLQIPNIRKKLIADGYKITPPQNDIYDVLMSIVNLIRNVSKNTNGPIQIPLALVLTKIDLLEQYNILPKDSCLREESEHIKRGAFLKPDFEETNIQVRDLIDNWLDTNLMEYITQFKQYSFFGVSSLGSDTDDKNKIDSKGILPRRVLDPFLWLLAIKGYIKTLEK